MGPMWALVWAACGPGVAPDAGTMEQQILAAESDARRLELLEVNTTRHPDDPNGWLWLARAYRKRDDPRAKATYERAIAVDPVGDIPRVELAWLELEPAMRKGEDPTPDALAAADARLTEAVAKNPSCFNKGQRLALIELASEDKPPATDALGFARDAALACASDASYGPAFAVSYGKLAKASGDVEAAKTWTCAGFDGGQAQAAADCLALLAQDPAKFTPTDARGHLLLAERARLAKDPSEKAHLDAALAADPSGWFVHERVADLAKREGRNLDACKALADARARVPATAAPAAPKDAVPAPMPAAAPLDARLAERSAAWGCPATP